MVTSELIGVRDTNMKKLSILVLFGVAFLLGKSATAANNNGILQVRHQEPTFVERHTKLDLSFEVPGINAKEVEEAYLFYRLDGEMAYRQEKAALMSSDFKVQILVDDRQANELEYYFEVHLNNGEKVTYPQNEASQHPVQVDVVEPRKTEREKRVEQTEIGRAHV